MKHPVVKLICGLVSGLSVSHMAFSSALSLDQNFRPPAFSASDYVVRAVLLPSQKYVLFRNPDSLKDQPGAAITRYLADGTLDSSFNFSPGYDVVSAATPIGNQLLVAATGALYGQVSSQNKVLLVNDDGSIDSTFGANAVADGQIWAFAVQPDGKILVVGFFKNFAGAPRQGIVRLLANGTVDPNFAAVTLQAPSLGGVYALRFVPADGKVLIGGDFSKVNGSDFPGVARLNSDGTLDSTFQPSGFTRTSSNRIRGIVVQSDNKILIGGKFTAIASQYKLLPVVRLNTDGSLDQSYGCFNHQDFGPIKSLAMGAGDKAIAVNGSVFRFNTDGTVDTSFHQPVLIDRSIQPFPTAFTIDLTNTGSMLIGGTFSNIRNASDAGPVGQNFGVARLNNDGTVDGTFHTSHETSNKASPQSFLSLSDGSALIAFSQVGFATFEGAIPHNFGRVSPNGSLDVTFDPIASYDPSSFLGPNFVVNASTFLPNGNLLVAGTTDGFTFSYGMIAPDGRQVPNYAPDYYVNWFTYAYPYRSTVLIGDPTGVRYDAGGNEFGGTELQRLNPNGSIDYSFDLDSRIGSDATSAYDPATGYPFNVAVGSNVLAVLQNGQILFTYFGQENKYHLVRLNADGSIDGSFQEGLVQVTTSLGPVPAGFTSRISAPYPVFTDAQELPSGKVIVVGEFSSYADSAAHGIVRLNTNGSVDSTFQPGAGAQWTQTTETADLHPSIDNIELSTDGKFLITGSFEAYNNVSLPGIASLNLDGTPDTTFVAPATRQKFDRQPAYLRRQRDGSYLLSGPYSFPGQTLSPSFIHIRNGTRFGIEAVTHSPTTTTINFDAVGGNAYRLEYKDLWSDPDWQPVPGVADFTGSATGNAQFIDATDGLSHRTYRVRLVP